MTTRAEPAVHVYCGPTITAAEVVGMLPGATVHPPVRHGDLLRLAAAPGDTVVIIDGVFHAVAAVRHKEILDLLASGVRGSPGTEAASATASMCHTWQPCSTSRSTTRASRSAGATMSCPGSPTCWVRLTTRAARIPKPARSPWLEPADSLSATCPLTGSATGSPMTN